MILLVLALVRHLFKIHVDYSEFTLLKYNIVRSNLLPVVFMHACLFVSLSISVCSYNCLYFVLWVRLFILLCLSSPFVFLLVCFVFTFGHRFASLEWP